jgi:hypothetical protein
VFVQHNYSQGDKQPLFSAASAGLSTSLRESFSVRGLALTRLLTLTEGSTSTAEMMVWNYLSTPTNVTWNYDTGAQNISNTSAVNQSLLIFLQTNYSSSAVYRTQGRINSSSYRDNQSGVVITNILSRFFVILFP